MFLAALMNFAVEDFVALTGISTTDASNPNAVAVQVQTTLADPLGNYLFPPETIYVDPVAADLMLGDIANNNLQVWGQITDDLNQFISSSSLLSGEINNEQCVTGAGGG